MYWLAPIALIIRNDMCCYADKMATIRENDSYRLLEIAITTKGNIKASNDFLVIDEHLRLSVMSYESLL